MQLAADLANDAVVAACAGSVAFLVAYVLLARGHRSEIGRALITMDAGLILALAPSVAARLFGFTLVQSAGYAWYYVGSLAVITTATWWRAWLVVKVQWRGRGNRH